jgi:hypothetical protein
LSRIDELPPDQRAALQLLLKQGRSYDDIAGMLRIEPDAVRERARAALDALGPEDVGLTLERQDEIADYLLGQQPASQRAATREFLEGSAAGRAWARVVATELRPLAGDALPEIPAEAAEVDEAFDALQARTEHREQVQKSSKLGGILLIAAVAILLVVGIIVLVSDGGDDGGGGSDAAETTATTQAPTPQVEATIELQRPEGQGGRAEGAAQVARQGGQRAVALVAQGLPAANQNRFYALWLYSSQEKAQFLGFPDPQPTGKQGRIETGFALPQDAANFDSIVVTRETRRRPETPGTIILRGELPPPGQGNGGGGTSTTPPTAGG